MNKTQLINYQSELLSERDDTIDLLNAQLDMQAGLVEMLEKQADHDEGLHKRLMADEKARHAAEKRAATEAATLQSIRNGFVPIEALRKTIRSSKRETLGDVTYRTVELGTGSIDTECNPIAEAILDALLVKPAKLTYTLTPQALSDFTAQAARGLAPKFANGGYTTPKVGDRVGVYYCGNN